MTSSSHSRQKAEGANWRDSCYNSRREVVTDKNSSMYQCKSSRYSLKPSGDRKELKESQFEQAAPSQPPHIRDVMDDAIKSGEGSRVNVNKPVAREHHNISEHSSSLVKEDHNAAITMNTYFLICLAFIFLRVINIIKSGFGINSLRHKWVVGLSTLVCWNEERLRTADPPPNNFGGKRSWAYIRSYTNVSASRNDGFGRYIKNLDYEYGTMSSCKLAYICICAQVSSWLTLEWATLSSKIATLACNILYTLVYFLSKCGNSGIKTHDKYSRYILVGLTLAYKVSSRVQCIFARFCTNWRELRPLVTSRAYGIKVSFEPCIGQKQLMPSYALVSNSPLSSLSLLSLLSLFSLLSVTLLLCSFCCCFYYYCCYEYFTVKGLYEIVTSLSLSLSLSTAQAAVLPVKGCYQDLLFASGITPPVVVCGSNMMRVYHVPMHTLWGCRIVPDLGNKSSRV